MSDAAMTRAREFMGDCDGNQWCVSHNDVPRHCQAYVEDLAALLDAYAAREVQFIADSLTSARARRRDPDDERGTFMGEMVQVLEKRAGTLRGES